MRRRSARQPWWGSGFLGRGNTSRDHIAAGLKLHLEPGCGHPAACQEGALKAELPSSVGIAMSRYGASNRAMFFACGLSHGGQSAVHADTDIGTCSKLRAATEVRAMPTVALPAVIQPSATHAALRFDAVSMVFPDGTHALDAVSLSIAPGEFVSIVGPSGCGKSTLLRIASGLETQTSGDVWVDRASLGYTFQDPTLLPWRKVLDNVELLLELRGVAPAERRRIALEQIERVGLAGFEQHYPRRLSGGMKMRASLARSLALNPGIFLFDEPFGALDEQTRERLNDELIALYQRQRFAGLFVTHSIPEAVYLSNRVVVMSPRPGRIVADFAVDFIQSRNADLRYTSAFGALCGEISRAMRQAMEESA